MRKFISYIVIFGLIFSCSKPKTELNLQLLTNEVYAYYFDSDLRQTKNIDSLYTVFAREGHSSIKFKIHNPNKNPILFFPICIRTKQTTGCGSILSYPDKFKEISFINMIVTDENNKTIEPDIMFIKRAVTNDFIYDFVRDSLNIEHYNKIGYEHKSLKWKSINAEFENKAMVIHPNETLTFDCYIKLHTDLNRFSNEQYYKLDRSKSYKLKLKFVSDFDNLFDWLTDSQIENIKENNYEIFQGELYSENEIPIIFKEFDN